jgi:hypothetical protein
VSLFLQDSPPSKSLSVDTNQCGPVEQATAFTDDEETHRAGVLSAVAGSESEYARIAGNLEPPRGGHGLSGPELDG